LSPYDETPFDAFWPSFRTTIVLMNSAINRRQAILDVGGFNESIIVSPDYDLWLRISRHHKFVSTPKVTANYRWHSTQISSQLRNRQFPAIFEGRFRYWTFARDNDSPEFAARLEEKMLHYWDEALWYSWINKDMNLLRTLLSFSKFMSKDTDLRRYLRIRANMPMWINRLWSAYQDARSWLRRAVHEV
jgi:hypothetical protein